WLGIDPVVVRVVLVVLAIFGGSGILLYGIGWLFIPLEGEPQSPVEQFIDRQRTDDERAKIPPLLIIPAVIIGVIVLGSLVIAGPWGGWWSSGGWLLLLASGGFVIWLMNRQPTHQDQTQSSTTGFAHGGAGDYPTYVAPLPAPTAPRPPRPRSYLGTATLSLAIIVVGVLSALSIADVVTIQPVAIMAVGLGVLGLGLLIGTFFGRALWLLAIAIPLAVVTLLASVVPTNLTLGDGVGERTWRPVTIAQVSVPYRLTLGEATLDLTQLRAPADATAVVPINAYLGVGDLRVILPADMNVELDASVGLGELKAVGFPVIQGRDNQLVTTFPAMTVQPAPTVHVVATMSIGTMEVSRA
ncbi:MAG: LiaF-related protein, partial [Actinomycetota bacterium]|nr:LiaF-related protein [Actinomycetota bacterium]